MEVKYTPEYRNEREYYYSLAQGSGLWDEKAVSEISDENRMDYIKAMAYYNQLEDTSKFEKYKYDAIYDADDKYNYLMWSTFSGKEDEKTYNANKKYFDEKAKEGEYRRIYDSMNWFEQIGQNLKGLVYNVGSTAIQLVEGLIDTATLIGGAGYALGGLISGGTQTGDKFAKEVMDLIAKDLILPDAVEFAKDFTHYQTGLEREPIWKIVNDITTNLARMSVNLIPYAGQMIYFGSMAGNVASEAIKENSDMSLLGLVAYTTFVTGVELATEKLVGDAVFGKGILNANKLASKMSNPILRYITKTGLTALGEGLEESLAEVLDGVLYQWFVDEDSSVSIEQVLYAGVIGALTSGITENFGILNTTKIGNLSKLDSNLLTALSSDLVQSIDTKNAVTELQAKYNISKDELVKTHRDEFIKAVEKDKKQATKIAKNYYALAAFSEKIGLENVTKAQELLTKTVEEQAARARAEVVYSESKFNAIEQKQVDLYNKRVKDGTHFVPAKTFNDTEYKLIDGIRQTFPGYTVVLGDVTSGENGKNKPMWNGVTIHDKVIFVNRRSLRTMSLEQILNKVTFHELIHTLQRDGNVLSKKMMDELDRLMSELGIEINYDKIDIDTLSEDENIIRAEKQAVFYSTALMTDSTVVNAVFNTNKSFFAKMYSWFVKKSKTISTKTTKGIKLFKILQLSMELYRKTIAQNVSNDQSANAVMDKIPELTETQREEIIATYQADKAYNQWMLSSFDNTELTTKILSTTNTLWDNVRPEFKNKEIDLTRITDENYYTDEFRNYILEEYTFVLFGENSFEQAMNNFLKDNDLIYHKKSNKLIKSVDMSQYIKKDVFNKITEKAQKIENNKNIENTINKLKNRPNGDYSDLLDINNYNASTKSFVEYRVEDTASEKESKSINYDKYLNDKFKRLISEKKIEIPTKSEYENYYNNIDKNELDLREYLLYNCKYLSDLFDVQKMSDIMNAQELADVDIIYTDNDGDYLNVEDYEKYPMSIYMSDSLGVFIENTPTAIYINLDKILYENTDIFNAKLYEVIIHESTHLIANSQGLPGGSNSSVFERALNILSDEELNLVTKTLKAQEYMLENQKADIPNIANILYQLVAGEQNARLFSQGYRFGTYGAYKTAIYIENGKFVFTGDLKPFNELSWNKPRTLKDLGLAKDIKPTYYTEGKISDETPTIRKFPTKRKLQTLLKSIQNKYNLKTLKDFKSFGFSQKFLNTIDVETEMDTNIADWKKLYESDEIMEKNSPNKSDVMEFLKDDLGRVRRTSNIKSVLNEREEIEKINSIKNENELKHYVKNRILSLSETGLSIENINKYNNFIAKISDKITSKNYDIISDYSITLSENLSKSFGETTTSSIEDFDKIIADEDYDLDESIETEKKYEAEELKKSLTDKKSFIKFISPKILDKGKISIRKIISYYNNIKTYMRDYLSEKELDKIVILLDYVLHKADSSAKNLPKIKSTNESSFSASNKDIVNKVLNLSENPTQEEIQQSFNRFKQDSNIIRLREVSPNKYKELESIKNDILKEKGFQRKDAIKAKLERKVNKLSKILEIKDSVDSVKNKITKDSTSDEMLKYISELDTIEQDFKKSVSKKKIISATVAPYLNTKLSNNNYEEIKSKVDKRFKNASKEIADLIGLKILGIHDNIGGYTMESGEVINEISYTFQFETSDTDSVDLFASLMGDLAYENQEAVISSNYVKDGGDGLEVSVIVKNTDNVRTLLNEAGINDFTIDLNTKEVKILEFPWMSEEDIKTLHENLNKFIDLLGDNYESATKSKIESRYLDRRSRQNLYKERITTTETSGQNRKLRDNTELKETIRQAYEVVSLELGDPVSLIETQSQSSVKPTVDTDEQTNASKIFREGSRKDKIQFVLTNTTEDSKLSDIKAKYNLTNDETTELKNTLELVYGKKINKTIDETVKEEIKTNGKLSEETTTKLKDKATLLAEDAKLITDLETRAELSKSKTPSEKTKKLSDDTKKIKYSERYTKSNQLQLDDTEYLQTKSHDEFKLQFKEIFDELEDDQVLPFLNSLSENVSLNSDEFLNILRAYQYVIHHLEEKSKISKEDVKVIEDNYAIIRRSESYALRGDEDYDREHPVKNALDKFREESDVEINITKETTEEALGDLEKLKAEKEELLKELKEEREKIKEYEKTNEELNKAIDELKGLKNSDTSVEYTIAELDKQLKDIQKQLSEEKELSEKQKEELLKKEEQLKNLKNSIESLKLKSIKEITTELKDSTLEDAYNQLVSEKEKLVKELEEAKKELKPKHPLTEEDNAELNSKIYFLEDFIKAINDGDYELVMDLAFRESSTGLLKEGLDVETIDKINKAVSRAMDEAIQFLKNKKQKELTQKQQNAKANEIISKLKNYRFFAMLSNPATWFRNYVGNSIMTSLSNISNKLYIKWHDEYTSKLLKNYNNDIEKALNDPNLKEEDKDILKRSIAKNQLTYRSNEEISEDVENFVKELEPWILQWSRGNKYDSAVKFGRITFDKKNEQLFKNKYLQKYADLVKEMLDKADVKYVAKYMRKAIKNILQANMNYIKNEVLEEAKIRYRAESETELQNILKSKIEQSKTASKYYKALFENNTQELLKIMPDQTFDLLIGTAVNKSMAVYFRNENNVSKMINKMGKEHPWFGAVIGITNPFIKVSTNIMKAFFEYSPFEWIAVIRDNILLKRNYKNAITEMEDMFKAANLSEKAAKASVGTIIFITGTLLAVLGKSLGVGVDFDDDEYMGAVFKITDSFKIRLSDLTPIGGVLALGSAFAELFRNPSKSLNEFVNLINEYTLLGTVNDYVQYNQNSFGLLGSILEGWITQYIPSVVRTLAKIIDPSQKKKESFYLLHLLETIASYIPGLSYAVPNKVNPYTGDNLYKSSNISSISSTGNRLLAHLFEALNAPSPIQFKLTIKSDLQKESERLGVGTSGSSGSFTINGQTINLIGFEKEKYSKIRADYVNKQLKALINSVKYKGMDDENRAKAIKAIYTNATELTKTIYWTDKGNTRVFTTKDEYNKYKEYLINQRNIIKRYSGYKGSKYIKK